MSRKQLQNLLIRRLPPAPETIWNQLEARLPEPAVNAAPSPASPRRMLKIRWAAAAAVFLFCSVLAGTSLLYYYTLPMEVGDSGVLSSTAKVSSAGNAAQNTAGPVMLANLSFQGDYSGGEVIPATPGGGDALCIAAFDEKRVLQDAVAVAQMTVLERREKQYALSHTDEGRTLNYKPHSMIYTLRIDRLVYSETDEIRQGKTVAVEVFSHGGSIEDYPLARGGEYVLPLYDAGEQAMTVEGGTLAGDNARSSRYDIAGSVYPQIQVTEDGRYLFYDWYESLDTADAQDVIYNMPFQPAQSDASELAEEYAGPRLRLRSGDQFLEDLKALVLKIKADK